jgi:uncharacterized membrane protein
MCFAIQLLYVEKSLIAFISLVLVVVRLSKVKFVCTEYACTDTLEAIKESLSEGERGSMFKQLMEYTRKLLEEIERGER